ncbi:MAG: endonuclease [Pseudomonadota bacterium]|jgi:endonuclease-3
MQKKHIIQIFSTFQEHNPEPKTELIYNSNFELLIAVMLSAQATDISVNKATSVLFQIANTPKQILELGEEILISHIKSIGLYKTKAKNVIKTCEMLISKHNGEVPNSQKDLEELAGVGRKTANVVRNVAFNELTMAVDTHIFRVSNRIGIAKGKNPLEVELGLLKNIPKEFMQHAHHWLILHGRYICKARSPECIKCNIKELCQYQDKNI